MITLEKWQAIPENEDLEVFQGWEYEPQDLVLCNRKGEDDAVVQFEAHFIATWENYNPPIE